AVLVVLCLLITFEPGATSITSIKVLSPFFLGILEEEVLSLLVTFLTDRQPVKKRAKQIVTNIKIKRITQFKPMHHRINPRWINMPT
ncbi:hypothetical protein ACSTI3_23755, partial [Vibrio parahaemolyticus]